MSTLVRLRSLFVPACIGLILVVAVGWYNFFRIPSENRYLDDRNFRVVKTLSEQIRLSINTFDKMMDNAADSGIKSDTLEPYLANVVPQLVSLEQSDWKPVFGSDDFNDPPRIAVAADDGTHFLYLAFKRRLKSTTVQYAVRTDLNKLIDKLLPPPNRSPFDVVLLAQSDGTVIFQKSLSGIDVERVNTLDDASGDTKTGKTGTPITMDSLSQSSRLEEVKLAGARYRLYSQPLQIPFASADPGRKSAKGPAADPGKKSPKDAAAGVIPRPWVVCGLVRADRFRSESQSISYTYILWLSAVILLAVAAYPFLRLYVFSPAERLRAVEVVTTAVFACFAAAALTFILLDLYYGRNDFDRPAEDQMSKLAEAIDSNFGAERDRAFDQLDDFFKEDPHKKNELRAALQRVRAQARPDSDQLPLPQFSRSGKECVPSWACRSHILYKDSKDSAVEPPNIYPYLQYVSWSDFWGKQRVKWTTKKNVTPFLNLDDPSILYYPEVRKALKDPEGPGSVPAQGVASQYSPNTGGNVTIFWKLFDKDGKPVTGKVEKKDAKKVFCASLVSRPISVVNPVLPDGFQFAIIRPDGMVVFHSDWTRNLRENFFAETDQDQDVRSPVLMRADRAVVTNYMGRRHRLYIRAMRANQEDLWTVVVFRDSRLEETMNLEVLSLASIMFFLYAGVIALGLLVAHWTRRGGVTGIWLWPDSRKARIYRQLLVVNGVAILLLFVILQLPALALLFCATFIPLGAMAFNVAALTRQPDQASSMGGGEETTSSRWRLEYVGACTTLLVVVAVLPCLSFFKVACDFEHKVFIEGSQLRLAAEIDDRAERVRSQYQGVDMDERLAKKLLARPEDPADPKDKDAVQPPVEPKEGDSETEPFFSYHKILGTKIGEILKTTIKPPDHADHPDGADRPQPATCGLNNKDNWQRCVDLFLNQSSPSYNELAADNRSLADAGSPDIRSWSLPSSGSEGILELRIYKPGKTGSSQDPSQTAEPGKTQTIASSWIPLRVPWAEWRWWAGTMVFMAALFGLVYRSLRRIFLLDLIEPARAKNLATVLDPTSLLAKLPTNLLIIGPPSSRIIADLIERKEVQAWDIHQVLKVPVPIAKAVGESIVTNSTGDQVDGIIRDGHPLVLCNFERALDDPDSSQKSLLTLQRVLSKLGKSVVITSMVDPVSKSPAGESEQWRTVLRSFVRIDLNSSPAQRVDETVEQFEGCVSTGAYHRWLFSGHSRPQKLVLVQLAQERLVNPNSHHVVCELMREGLIERRWGLLTIRDDRFADFLECAVPPNTVKRWERQGSGVHSASLRTYLLVAGLGVAAFLIYTQGAVFNTWVTYATGLAASVPAFLHVFDIFRRGKGAEV
ncbi:MAG TPA: hypothetical protein VN948_21420 [Terriglobales bacterium]|nr:hypothetical protein [Terriglobales bacterium]